MEHPTICFAVTQHNEIIPLKVTKVKDYKDGCYRYTFDINHPKPSEYMKRHYEYFFQDKFVSEEQPLCDQFTPFRLTLEEALALSKRELKSKEADLLSSLKSTRKQINNVEKKALELAEAIGLSQP